jgi:hypothetical protein
MSVLSFEKGNEESTVFFYSTAKFVILLLFYIFYYAFLGIIVDGCFYLLKSPIFDSIFLS